MASPLPKRQHPKGPCRNKECFRPFCQGYQLGFEEGYGAGYEAGFAAGMAAAAGGK